MNSQVIQEAYRDHLMVWLVLSLAGVVLASWALWREKVRARTAPPARRLTVVMLGAVVLVCAYVTPFIALPVAQSRMGAMRDEAMKHVGSTPDSLVAACGVPASRSDSWIVYRPPWFLLWPVDVRVLVLKDRVAVAYLDD